MDASRRPAVVFAIAVSIAVLGPGAACSPSATPAPDGSDGHADAAESSGDVPGADAEGGAETAADGSAGDAADATGDGGTRLPYGDPCSSSSDCGTAGFCIDMTLDPGFVGGYCTALFCDLTAPATTCGADGTCFDTEVYPPLCAKMCTTDADCRTPDYACVGSCIPVTFTATLDRPGILTGGETAIADFLERVDDARMMQRVRVLAGEEPWDGPSGAVTIHSRATLHPDHALAADYLEAELSAPGWTVRRLDFTHDTLTLTNIEADIPGTDPSLAPVLITAHWDSTAMDTVGWDATTDPAPGAVDNGSGVAVALEAATILGTAGVASPVRPVHVVLFDSEEEGLIGSAEYVGGLTGDIACAVNTDMIGWTTRPTAGRFWYVFDDASRSWAGLGIEAIDLFVPAARPITTDYGDAGHSDSSSFWAGSRCAVGLSSWPRKLSNHHVTDTTSEFEPVFHDIARASLAVAAAWIYAATDP